MNRIQGEALLKAIGVPPSKRDEVWGIVEEELRQYSTPQAKAEMQREALIRLLLKAPLKGAAKGAAVGLGIKFGGDLIAPHAGALMPPVIARGFQGLSKRYNLGDMSKGPLFPMFTTLGVSGYETAKEALNYYRLKKRGYF